MRGRSFELARCRASGLICWCVWQFLIERCALKALPLEELSRSHVIRDALHAVRREETLIFSYRPFAPAISRLSAQIDGVFFFFLAHFFGNGRFPLERARDRVVLVFRHSLHSETLSSFLSFGFFKASIRFLSCPSPSPSPPSLTSGQLRAILPFFCLARGRLRRLSRPFPGPLLICLSPPCLCLRSILERPPDVADEGSCYKRMLFWVRPRAYRAGFPVFRSVIWSDFCRIVTGAPSVLHELPFWCRGTALLALIFPPCGDVERLAALYALVSPVSSNPFPPPSVSEDFKFCSRRTPFGAPSFFPLCALASLRNKGSGCTSVGHDSVLLIFFPLLFGL